MEARVIKASTKAQGRGRGARGLRGLTVLGAAAAVLVAAACGTGEPAATGSSAPTNTAAAGPVVLGDDDYLQNASAFVDPALATWDAKAETVKVDMGEMYFKPFSVNLEAGKPYVVEVSNSGKTKHEFAANKFFRSVATRKAVSAGSEVEAPFVTALEVMPGKSLKLFVIPVIPGAFEMLCEIKGHREAGMEGVIKVTGSKPATPAPVLGSMKAGPWVQNGPALVAAASPTWDAQKETIKVESGESGAKMVYKPKDITMKVGKPYVLELVNTGKTKHEYTAPEFFPTVAFRRAQDAAGEVIAPVLKEAEVLPGKKLDLHVIPTKAGKYKVICQIPGHTEAGMEGTITVTP